MPRPQGAENTLDAAVLLAGPPSAATLARSFVLADMPRLQEAGVREGSSLKVDFRFRNLEGRVAIGGVLEGVARLTCQRCMNAVDVPLRDEFNVILVQDDVELSAEVAGYEPVLGDPTRVDLRALAEDQALLALPLVPRHELDEKSDECTQVFAAPAAAAAETSVRQTPFQNLRDMMGKQ
jgi:uncharacterized protein